MSGGSVEPLLTKISFTWVILDDKFLDTVFTKNICTPISLSCTSNKNHKSMLLPVSVSKQSVASDQSLYYLQIVLPFFTRYIYKSLTTGISIKHIITNNRNKPDILLFGKDLSREVVEKSTRRK